MVMVVVVMVVLVVMVVVHACMHVSCAYLGLLLHQRPQHKAVEHPVTHPRHPPTLHATRQHTAWRICAGHNTLRRTLVSGRAATWCSSGRSNS